MAATLQTSTINLAGEWKYALDPRDRGETELWYRSQLQESGAQGYLTLPGTLTLNGIGDVQEWSKEMTNETVRSLRQRYSYYGAAWYEYEAEVPADWSGKHLKLFLERVMFQSTLWVNGQFAGRQDSLSVAHEFDVTAFVEPGVSNRFTLQIDNRDIQNLGTYPSAYTEETQSIWNGMIGRIELQAVEPFHFTDLQIFPEPGLRSVKVRGICHNITESEIQADIMISAVCRYGESGHTARPAEQKLQLSKFSSEPFEWLYELGEDSLLWDEFHPNLYELKIEGSMDLEGVPIRTSAKQTFGMRNFERKGRVLEVNGRPVFLRGTLECCIFPLTGHPPMDIEAWFILFGTAKDYGLNHIRFHSWSPPEAAFEAADRLGVYLQVESPIWMDTWNLPVGTYPEHYTYLPIEAQRIVHAYGNHPSFCIYSNGNELNGDFSLLHNIVANLKEQDNRHLYTLTTNWDRPLDPADDLFCAQTVDEAGARGQYFLNEISSSTETDFREAISRRNVPVVTHEVGQYSVYPDVEEIDLYIGALRPVNLEAIRADLDRRGLLASIRDLVHGSGMLALQLYREEIEAALRTPELGGFQLLDLHDFPGQSTATVGILNAFWQSKGLIEPQQFREFCGPTVLLLRMSKRIYTAGDTFSAELNISHFGENELPPSEIKWRISNEEGMVLDQGVLQTGTIPLGAGILLGRLPAVTFEHMTTSARLTVSLEMTGSSIRNEWPIWVYAPTEGEPIQNPEITIASTLDDELLSKLTEGERVLFLIKNNTLEHSAPGKFHPVFWSPVHFATENPCGISVHAEHPVFKDFPTRNYAEFQWTDLLDRSVSLVVNDGLAFDPIVQVIPNFYHNRRLTNLTEYTIGAGKLLICGIDIQDDLDHRPAAAQLRKSLLRYMSSAAFNPQTTLEADGLRELLKKKEIHSEAEAAQTPEGRELAVGKAALSDSVKDSAYEAKHGNDGMAHSLWLAEDELPGHWWQVDLGEERSITGTRVKFHQEGNFLYVIQTSLDGKQWNVASNQTGQTSADQTRIDRFDAFGRYVRIVYNRLPKDVCAGHYFFEVYGG